MEILVFLTTMSFSVMVVCQIWTEYLGPFWGKLRIAVCGSWTWIIVNMSGTQVDGCASQCDFCVKKTPSGGRAARERCRGLPWAVPQVPHTLLACCMLGS